MTKMIDDDLGIVGELELKNESLNEIDMTLFTYEDKELVIHMRDEESHVVSQLSKDSALKLFEFLKTYYN